MTWDPRTSCGKESRKVAHLVVPYVNGTALDVGCGNELVWPHLIGVDNDHHARVFNIAGASAAKIKAEANDLRMFANRSVDAVFSSHVLEHMVDPLDTLREWWRVIRPGGYLTLYLPHKNFYPNIGVPGANPDHKHDFMPEDVIGLMRVVAERGNTGWTLLENEDRNQHDEYSFFQVYRKELNEGKCHEAPWRKRLKSLLLHRYGAIGDMIITSSALSALKRQGWHITLATTPRGAELLKHDPNVDSFWIQQPGLVPHEQLMPYWMALEAEGRWDKIINLTQSIEGQLLTEEAAFIDTYSDFARRKIIGRVNYLERTHDICEAPHDLNPRFYPSDEEDAAAANLKRSLTADGNPVVTFALVGSSVHKTWPWWNVLLSWVLKHTPASVVILGDDIRGKLIADTCINMAKEDGADVARVHSYAGDWSARQALAWTRHTDVLVGPETGMMWGASYEPKVEKILFLSHSSYDNIAKTWKSTVALSAPNTPCYPCHRLHHNYNRCHVALKSQNGEPAAALCAANISPEIAMEAVKAAMRRRGRKAA